jgi:hypothetical protein
LLSRQLSDRKAVSEHSEVDHDSLPLSQSISQEPQIFEI